MLQFALHREDVGRWAFDRGIWRCGRSFVGAFTHPALETWTISGKSSWLYVVRERLLGRTLDERAALDTVDDEAVARAWVETREWPLEFTGLLITRVDGTTEARVCAGCWGSAPLYLAEDREVLRGSWDPAELFDACGIGTLNPEVTAALLIRRGAPYSAQTVIEGIKHLTERSEAVWSRDGLAILYPEAISRVPARRLHPHADPVGAFGEILRSSVRRWASVTDGLVGAELSGGLDTASVCTALCAAGRTQLRAFGLVMPALPGMRQQERRTAVSSTFALLDTAVLAADYPPFSSANRRNAWRVVPWEENYEEAFTALLKEVNAVGVDTLFNGNGGDELCFLHYEELAPAQQTGLVQEVQSPPWITRKAVECYRDSWKWLDRAPRSKVPRSALSASAASSPLYLRHGVWSASPLATPELYQFCRILPVEWRRERRIQREYLLRTGLPRSVAYPVETETFEDVLDLGLRRVGRSLLTELFTESRLADLGFVDRDRLMCEYSGHLDGNTSSDHDFADLLYETAILELTLRCLEVSRCRP